MSEFSTSPPANKPEPIGQRVILGADGLLRPIWRAVMFIFVVGLGLPAVARGISALPRYIPVLRLNSPRFGNIIQFLLLNLVLLLVTALFIRVFDRRSVRTLGLWFYAGWTREAAMGICCGGALIAATIGGIILCGGAYYPGLAGEFVFWLLPASATALFVLLGAAVEEIAFRGYAFQRLVDSIGQLGAVVVLSALFGVVHLNNPGHPTAISTANTALAGVLLAITYLKTRGLWMPIGLHWAWNFFLGPVFGLPVSGFTSVFRPFLLRAHVGGPEWLTGASYGPEGSILLTVTCIAAIVWLARTESIFPSPEMAKVLE